MKIYGIIDSDNDVIGVGVCVLRAWDAAKATLCQSIKSLRKDGCRLIELECTPISKEPAAQSGETPVQQLKNAIALVRKVAFSQNHHKDGLLDGYLTEIEQRASV